MKVRIVSVLTFAFLLGALLQPLENMLSGEKPFGLLECKILGYDPCGGSVDPNSLVVAPVLDFPKEDSWISKVMRGWMPSQVIPGSDVPHGGFGWIWIVSIFYLFWNLKERGGALNFGILRKVPNAAAAAILMTFAADLVIPAFWYPRYHMAFGWALSMIAANWLQFAEDHVKYRSATAYFFRVALFLLALQLVWVLPQRTWFLGIHSHEDFKRIGENLKSIVTRGFPEHATNSADLRSIKLLGLSHKEVHICGDGLRPSLGAFGADLSNRVFWYKNPYGISQYELLPPCPNFAESPEEIIKGETNETTTLYWIKPRAN